MREYAIGKNEAGQRMDKYLLKVLREAPKSFVYKMLRKKNIVLNGRRASGSEILREDDRIRIYFSEETFARFAPEPIAAPEHAVPGAAPDIVYEDDEILVIDKPAGLLSQKSAPQDYSANEMIIDYLLRSGQLTAKDLATFRPSVCNRLDRNTSGLLIAGKTVRGLQKMSSLLRSRELEKYYRCLVLGEVSEAVHLTGYLVKDHRANRVTVLQNPRGEEKERPAKIETAYRPIRIFRGVTLLEVHLITGRTHQIRAHLASAGYPILGDGKYGDARANRVLKENFGVQGQLLCAYRMQFPDGKTLTAKEPEWSKPEQAEQIADLLRRRELLRETGNHI